ncbi:MAG: signal recognition particle-docking protein FtsY, partial [Rhodanobacter sp.]
MRKFWKKKPTDKEADSPAPKPAVAAGVPEGDQPTLHEALAEVPAPTDTLSETERFAVPPD